MQSVLKIALAGTLSVSASWVSAQDGLADEAVTLNQIDPAQMHVEQSLRQDEAHRPYRVPQQREDGVVVADLYERLSDADGIATLRQQIGAGKYGNIDSLLISHQGQLLVEDYWGDGAQDTAHFQFSITKNLMSLAIGKAIELGLIASVEERVLVYFPELASVDLAPGADRIRIVDLLTMRSGLNFDAAKLDAQGLDLDNHVARYLSQSGPIVPGRQFQYQGADTDILNHILHRISGQTLAQFVDEHYFGPMGISNVFWEASACGLVKASSGLHLTSRDMVKLGSMILADGEYQGEALVNAQWVRESTSPKTPNGKYGYYWWTENFWVDGVEVETISGRGARGQFIYMMPELKLVVVVTSSNSGKARRAPFDFTPQYILPGFMGSR
ncbi:serine hydrolase [Ferrimonas pelagia]|uniref:Beta-lactamase-related domain-containing protein n=1 Tax=Ferrimonas pelagia TaxID=1177826 RepID=A0ABP9EWH8_9GAMM